MDYNNIQIKDEKNVKIISKLNKTVQDLHYKMDSKMFKKYNYKEIEKHFFDFINKPEISSLIIYNNNKPIGYVIYKIKDYKENPFRRGYKSIHIDQFSVIDEFQKKGIGKIMLDKIKEIATKNKIQIIELNVWTNNNKAINFYKKNGFLCLNENRYLFL
jgi:diamine N-acetyltransferase